ncbi:hypothetical protein DAERI_330001 [Deinococcus aerius]|uniref:DUF3825 domain-containing protein n=1 Tax=Deinococcus aerius TaxID=200253 RepID=A0A2I9DC41_9DEIO|nr:DUF3825 domain-containing protein [Deinococcus aerius]GBF08260.1 hypothetical protein DAERI_330001 [Deinococcus aerius]
MTLTNLPELLRDLIHIPTPARLEELAQLAEPEDWSYQHVRTQEQYPVLLNYLRYTYKRLAEETRQRPHQPKIVTSDDGQAMTFNTGLVTPNQEAIYAFAAPNQRPDAQPWFLVSWSRRGEMRMNAFSALPEMAHYFDDPAVLVFDHRKELRTNVEHIISDNKERFPDPYRQMDNYQLQTFLQGAIMNAVERVRRNYKAAIPQYYWGRVQLLLPLCLTRPGVADLALVVEDLGAFYRASTCLTLDMAYNNARQLARPDRDWLHP